MTRRLVMLMVGLVVTTLVVAGVGTLVLLNVCARATTEQSLRQQAIDVSSSIGELVGGDEIAPTAQEERQRLRQLTVLRRALDLDGFAVLTLTRSGSS